MMLLYMIKIKKATAYDLDIILEVFKESIETLAKNDYNPDQIAAWTASANNTGRWLTAIEEQCFLLAVMDEVIAGFGSLKGGDYLDFLYVNKNYSGRGIANRLFQELEQESYRLGKTQISAYVSKTALGFFQKKGFKQIKENIVEKGSTRIVNYYMLKELKKII